MRAMNLASSEDCFEELVNAYSEKHRFYHTGQHISAMLRHFDRVKQLAKYPNEVEVAIWFHDAIYKPLSSTNEIDSADWAHQFLANQGVAADTCDRVHSLIMATLHNGVVNSEDAKLLVDIDLTILGAPDSDYAEFEKNVRKEYKLVPKFIYRKKRKEVLSSFLDMESIYHNEYFREKFECSARSNMMQAIESL